LLGEGLRSGKAEEDGEERAADRGKNAIHRG
jgi:hypothetical protein